MLAAVIHRLGTLYTVATLVKFLWDYKMKIVVTTAFGIEKLAKNEIKRLGYTIESVEDGSIVVDADASAVAALNVHLRCAERVFILLGQAKLTTFDDLFDFVKGLPWCDYLFEDSSFPVLAKSKKSKLFSLSDIQAISKKAIVNALAAHYKRSWFRESAGKVTVHVNFDRDVARVLIDTSGEALHKRGYRSEANAAPIKETLAAAMVLLSDWRFDHHLIDPMCGSGTIAIEAALIARNIAPGLQRKFAFENFKNFDSEQYKQVRQSAYQQIDYDRALNISASDIDGRAVALAKNNAERAGVDEDINFSVSDFKDLAIADQRFTLICNPPYGERLESAVKAEQLYRALAQKFGGLSAGSHYILTSHDGFEAAFGKKATRLRKLYNGRIKCNYYQYRLDRKKGL